MAEKQNVPDFESKEWRPLREYFVHAYRKPASREWLFSFSQVRETPDPAHELPGEVVWVGYMREYETKTQIGLEFRWWGREDAAIKMWGDDIGPHKYYQFFAVSMENAWRIFLHDMFDYGLVFEREGNGKEGVRTIVYESDVLIPGRPETVKIVLDVIAFRQG